MSQIRLRVKRSQSNITLCDLTINNKKQMRSLIPIAATAQFGHPQINT